MKKVLLIDSCHAYLPEGLSAFGHLVLDVTQLNTQSIIHLHADAFGMVVRSRFPINAEFLQHFGQLKWIARFGAGMENIDVVWAENRGIRCLHAAEGNRDAVGEHALGMLLCLFNRLHIADFQLRNGQWLREANRGEELAGKTIGIIGYGNMGSAFAKKLTGMDVRILAYDKYKFSYAPAWVEETTLELLMQQSDVISLHLPQNKETKHLINKNFWQALGKPIYLINTSRGNQVETNDLVEALKNGRVLGACLDVFEFESSSFETIQNPDYAEAWQYLITAKNTLLTPHIAGWTHSSNQKMAEILLEKITAL